MGFRRTLTLAILAMWGFGAQPVPARADGAAVPADDYSPYAPSGFFVLDWSGFYVGGHLGLAHTLAESSELLFPDNPTVLRGPDIRAIGNLGDRRHTGRMAAAVG